MSASHARKHSDERSDGRKGQLLSQVSSSEAEGLQSSIARQGSQFNQNLTCEVQQITVPLFFHGQEVPSLDYKIC
jgi:hypothetical protein